ncbi:hypothetical protein [Desulfosporosinus nitroreducens]|uniref:hypothetical protein n=1 Tax=Desulfosporosinus nitroreducens TaxID=2018668 RepID=UPI00207CFC76|nr:hypothetical protein [Desulfosporosinus nitroreducens]MCO1603184.1 hypothetical protein [Desulfosporosinus nitroreducens]
MDANPAVDDFTVSQAIDGGEGSDVTPSDVTLDPTGKVVTLTVDPVVATAVDQSVVYSVSYKGGDTVAAPAFLVNGFALAVTNVQVVSDNNTKLTTVTASVKNAEEGATATVTIFAYDAEGALKETPEITVPGVAIEGDAIEKEINVAALVSADYVAVVTLDEVTAELEFTLDFAAVDAAVASVNLANTEPKLWTALQNSLFTGPKIELITKYRTFLGTTNEKTTVKAIQDVIDSVNVGEADKALMVQIKGASTQIELLALLEANFEGVVSDLINEYQDAVNALEAGATKADLQDAIDLINDFALATSAVQGLVDEEGNLVADQAGIDAAQVLVDALPADVDPDTTKANLQDAIDSAQVLLDAANLEAQVVAATVAVEALVDEEGSLVANQADIDAAQVLVDALPADVDPGTTKADLQVAIDSAQALLDAADLEAQVVAATVAVTALVDEEGNLVADQAGIDAAQVLVDALPADVDPDTTKADLQVAIDSAQVLLDSADVIAATAAVNALVDEENNLIADQDAIDAAQALVEALPADVDPDTTKADLQDAIDTAQELLNVANINTAIEAKNVVALQSIIVEYNLASYNNLTNAQRVELTEYIIANTTDPVTSTVDFEAAIFTEGAPATGYVSDYLADIATVNNAASITAMRDALTAIDYDVYNGLTSVEKLNVAEEILAIVGAENFVDYTLISQIQAAIDASIN